jgi:glyoxylase-like metal-dependent hydrolase (beta-lactamase superfamily II)
MRITDSVHRVGDDTVGCYLIEEAGQVTVVDAGMAGHYGQLFDELAAMGRTIDDVRALVLTHGHEDHIGFAERLRATDGVPVSVHELDAALARGEVPNPSPGLGERKLVPLLSFLLYGLRRGGLRTRHLAVVETFSGGATLDVPGALEVIHTPGHTPGNCALHAPAHDILLAGDTLATLAVTSGRSGPQIAPFTADPAGALASLASIEGLEASWVLPGHGAPWSGGVAAAVAEARKTGVAHLPSARAS